jgi:hypothetical protein
LKCPIIPLSGGIIEFHFDMLSDEQEALQYIVRHCDKNWKISDLMTSEYINGFNGDQIRDFDISFNTLDDYVHYTFTFPNSISSPRISGNYVAIIYRNGDPDIPENQLACIKFIVYEELVTIAPRVSPSSIISERFKKQEADCEVVFGNFKVYDPSRDLSLKILQNDLEQNTSQYLSPLFIRPDRVSFDYNEGQNTFDGGNEWRHFDLKNLQYVSDELSAIQREEDGWHAYLRQDIPESKRAYSFKRDINGTCLIQNDLADDSHLESEYVLVQFVLTTPEIPESEVIIDLPGNFCETHVVMTYSPYMQSYKSTVKLKQGYYNYRYAVRDRYVGGMDISFTEGNHSATENKYNYILYDSNPIYGYDRIIGYTEFSIYKSP